MENGTGSDSYKIEIEFGDKWFSVIGPQLNSAESVKMKCRYRGDGECARFKFNGHTIDAISSNLKGNGERGLTTIGNGHVQICQVEHILSALYGMGCLDTDIELYAISNDTVSISPPVVYLNSRDFTLAIRRTFFPLNSHPAIDLDKTYIFEEETDKRDKAFALFVPYKSLNITTHINFPYFWGNKIVSFEISPEKYEQEICWARSFFATPFPHQTELSELREKFPKLIRERNIHYRSIMIDYDSQAWKTRVFSEDEPARHKLLDFIGDISLLGKPLNASVYAYKPHHQFNQYCVSKLRQILFD